MIQTTLIPSIRSVSLTAALFLVSSGAGAEHPIAAAQRLQQTAAQLYQDGDYVGFTDRLEQALALNPSSYATRYNLACGYARTGQADKALELLEQLVDARVDFVAAIDTLDVDGVARSFTNDATAFYPFSFTPDRLDGRDAIYRAQARGFDLMRAGFPPGEAPTSLGLAPSDLEIRMLGPDAAVATWHSHRPTHSGRRTSVLQRVGERWLTVSNHASNVTRAD